jgi:hypothetical protein
VAGALILDAEAVNALARARQRGVLAERAAVDAFVVATALEFRLAAIATGDPDDLRRLATGAPNLRILAI